MVFEGILEKILSRSIGMYVTNIDKKNLKTDIWNGNVVIENVGFAPSLIELIGMP